MRYRELTGIIGIVVGVAILIDAQMNPSSPFASPFVNLKSRSEARLAIVWDLAVSEQQINQKTKAAPANTRHTVKPFIYKNASLAHWRHGAAQAAGSNFTDATTPIPVDGQIGALIWRETFDYDQALLLVMKNGTPYSRRDFVKSALIGGGVLSSGLNAAQVPTTATPASAAPTATGFRAPVNGDEARYADTRIGSFTKALPHNELGLVTPSAFEILVRCLEQGPSANFEAIPTSGRFRLANPQAAFAFAEENFADDACLTPPPPAFASAELAGEAMELYWQSLLRDVPFAEYSTHAGATAAARELDALTEFKGPRAQGHVTPETLFRGSTPGDLAGPYISQFLYMDVPYGATRIVQHYKVPTPGDDHLYKYRDWLNCQRGYYSKEASPFDPQVRYIRNGRDLGEFVRRDFCNQAFLNATLICLGESYPKKSFRVPFAAGFPYLDSDTQSAFATFGGPWVVDLATRVCNLALKGAWRDKWLYHRRVRPEEFGGHLQNHLEKKAVYPIPPALLASEALRRSREKFGSALLPQAYPDGCPIHPAYPAGHAVAGGSCITVLKALLDADFVFPTPVTAAEDGMSLVPYHGPPLTVQGELNKLAANIAIGRNFAGIHWRSDAWVGLLQGEAVALEFLRRQKAIVPEKLTAWRVKTFSGNVVEV